MVPKSTQPYASPDTRSASSATTQAARRAIAEILAGIREALHRRGRLSSRNEALDEISRLLFAHVQSLIDGGPGITATSILSFDPNPSVGLSRFVSAAFESHLPPSLHHELDHGDFQLLIKPNETVLATELIDCFEKMTSLTGEHGTDALVQLDLLNDTFGTFLANSFVDEKELGQYLTPMEIIEFMVQLSLSFMSTEDQELIRSPIHCADFGYVLDPSCGVGSFLTEFLRTAGSTLTDRSDAERMSWITQMSENVIVGMDKSERMIKLALTNLALFRFPAAQLLHVNSLALNGDEGDQCSQLNGKVGLILTNPPFGATFSGEDLKGYRIAGDWASARPTSIDSEMLFLERYLDWLRPGGQLLAIVPDSILTNRGLFEDLRKGLAEEVAICSVTSLPSITFASAGTTTKTSILHLKKTEKQTRHSSAFAICNDVGFNVVTKGSIRQKISTGTSDLPQIFRNLTSSRPKNESMTIRWIRNAEQEDRWDASFHASLPDFIQHQLDSPPLDSVRISDVAELAADKVDPRSLDQATFDYIEISDVDGSALLAKSKAVATQEAPGRARRLVAPGDVLVSTVRPERKSVAVIRDDQVGAVATTGFAVLRPAGIHPYVLGTLLRSDFVTAQLIRSNVGIAYPAIDERCLLDVLLPIKKSDLHRGDNKADEVFKAELNLQEKRAEFEAVVAPVFPADS